MNLTEVLQAIDNNSLKTFDERDICTELKKLLPENKDDIDSSLLAEVMAFDFMEDYEDKKSGWGTYFGPMYVITSKEGSVTESPSIQLISPEMIEYWNRRISESKNPLLIARYAGLVWDFQHKITGNNPNHQICRTYIKALILISQNKTQGHQVYVFHKLERALKLSMELNDNEIINDCKDALISFEKINAEDTKPGLWGYCFDLLVSNKKVKLSKDEETKIIDDLISRFRRLSDIDNPDSKIDIWAAENAANRLASYYRKKNNNEQVKDILLTLGNAFKSLINDTTGMQASSLTEQLYNIYKNFNLHEEAEELLISLRELGPKNSSEMGTVSHSFNIPKDKLEKYVNSMVKGTVQDFLNRFVITYTPNKEKTKEQIFDLRKSAPMMYLLSTTIQDEKGRAIARIGSLENDLEGHIAKTISETFYFSSLFIRLIIDKAQLKFKLSTNDILTYIENSPIIKKERLSIISKSLDAYFSNDYIVFIHLLIPQIEEAIRSIVEMAGGNVLKQTRGGSFHLRAFDEILRDEIILDALGEDFADYFRILFTDQRGWNLRNNVCHGLKEANMFNSQIADRLLHALLCLGLIQTKE